MQSCTRETERQSKLKANGQFLKNPPSKRLVLLQQDQRKNNEKGTEMSLKGTTPPHAQRSPPKIPKESEKDCRFEPHLGGVVLIAAKRLEDTEKRGGECRDGAAAATLYAAL